jgi:hypothetical protein
MSEEEQLLDLETDDQQQKDANRTEQRLRMLNSEKAKLAADKEELAKAKVEAEAKTAAALKDADFYKNFSTVSSKYTGASEYQDKIREKVNAGYDLEDATISILAKEGKYAPQAPVVTKESPIGGSAVNTFKAGGDRTIAEMTQAERRAQLVEAEKRGDLGLV